MYIHLFRALAGVNHGMDNITGMAVHLSFISELEG